MRKSIHIAATVACVALFTSTAMGETYVPEAPSHQSGSYDEVNNAVIIKATAPTHTEYNWDDWLNPQQELPYISYVLVERHVQNTSWPENAEVGRVENPALGEEFTFVDTTVAPDTKYDYRLTCYVDQTRGQYSSYVNVYTGVTPGQIQAFSATVADHTTTTVDLQVTAPSLTASGNPLSSDFNIEIMQYADWTETTLHTIEHAQPGQTYTWQHTGLTMNKAYHYRAYARVGSTGRGEGREADTYVGLDVPGIPRNLSVSTQRESASLSWQQPEKGYYGGAYDPANTTYKLTRIYHDGTSEVAADRITGTEYTDNPGFEEAATVTYSLVAVNDAGESYADAKCDPVSFGPAASLPFCESFSNQMMQHRGWLTESTQDDEYYTYKAWRFQGAATMFNFPMDEYVTIDPQDDDEGLAVCLFYSYSPDGQTESLITPALNTSSAQAIAMSFYFFDVSADSHNNELTASVRFDNGDWQPIFARVPQMDIMPGWRKAEGVINTNNASTAQVRIDAIRHDGPIVDTFIDNIKIEAAPAVGVDNVVGDNMIAAEYFTLQGLKISCPTENGIYIVRRGNETRKIVVR